MLLKRLYTRLRALHRSLLAGRLRICTRRGLRYELDLAENIDAALYYRGYYDAVNTAFFERRVTPDMNVLDVGANVGAYTLLLASILAKGRGNLYAFEPTSWAFGKLQRNLSLNQDALPMDRVHALQMALSDTNGHAEIECGSSQESMPFKASWRLNKKSQNHRKDRIHFQRLDDWVTGRELDHIDLIKIDVDGYEGKVLRGGKETIRKHRPILTVELGHTSERVGDSLEAILSLLDELEYGVHAITPDERPFSPADVEQEVSSIRTLDCLCLPREQG